MTVTFAELEAKIRAYAELLPDFVYTLDPKPDSWSTSCKYEADERNPLGCIVGAAARELWPETNGFDGRTGSAGSHIHTAMRDGLIEGSDDDRVRVLDWVNAVQVRQDGGESWGQAVLSADAERERRFY